MVCSVGSGRMAVMARLLSAGSLSENVAEEDSQQKLAVQCIYRELHEADEVNLLDEEDMHVFGLEPMADPLHLVCCNACKKPVKASQYAAHAELCRSLSSAEEMKFEPDDGIGHRKPPRKERKKLLTTCTNQGTATGEPERSGFIDVDDTAAAESQLNGPPRVPSSLSMDSKRNSPCVDVVSMMDGKGVSPENLYHSACVMPPPTKRHKVLSGQHGLVSYDPETASGLTKVTNSRPVACRDLQMQSTLGIDRPQCPREPHDGCLLSKDIPVPLATKVYYSQRNNCLRSAVAQMYHVSSAEGLCRSMVNPDVANKRIMQSQPSSHFTHEQEDKLIKKGDPSASQPNQILAQYSEARLDKSGENTPATNCSNQFPVDNISRPQQASPVGLIRSKYLQSPYTFTGNSGQSLGTMQQTNGSVPVL